LIPYGQINDPEKRAKWESYLEDCFSDRRFYIEDHLKIRTVDKKIAPLKLNEAQERLFELVGSQERAGKPVRIIGVKPRKVGLSTGIQGIMFHVAGTHPLTKGLTVAHDLDSTEEIFQMAGLFYDELPDPLKPLKRYSNRKELVFENPDERTRKAHPGLRSQLRVATAGDPDLGRSKDVHILHCSEMGYWPKHDESLLSVLNSVPDISETMVFKEGTPNGWNTPFHKDYLAARDRKSAYLAYFMAWHEFKSYRMALSVLPERFADSITDEEREIQKAYSLTLEQLNWRRWAIENKCGRDPDKFRQEYPGNDVECWLLSGRPRFDRKKLQGMLLAAADPKFRCYPKDKGFIVDLEENVDGYVRIWKFPRPGHRYVIGCDVAEGLEKGDFSCGHVLDREDLSLCAEWHGHIDPDAFGDELAKLGKMYNMALIGVEDNNHGGTTNRALRRLGYGNLFYRQELDDRVSKKTQKLGWHTNTASRPIMIDDLAGLVRDGYTCPSKETIEEMLSFVVKPDGKAEAEEDCFDDRVIASAIAVQIHKSSGLDRYFPALRNQQRTNDEPKQGVEAAPE
jgi:hypothetical protein